MTVPGLPVGAPLASLARIKVSGILFAAAEAAGCCAEAFASVGISEFGTPNFASGSVLAHSPPLPSDFDNDLAVGTKEVALVFQNGVPRTIGFTIAVNAFGSVQRGDTNSTRKGENDVQLLADYFETIKWDGLTSVVNTETGELVENWSISSESGFDYSQPYQIPEPSSILFLASGIVWLTSARIVRSRH